MYTVLTEVTSLDKIRSAADLTSPIKRFTLLGGEHYAYQIAVSGSEASFSLKVISPFEKYIKLYSVKLVPMDRPCYINSQDKDIFISNTPCLMPDILEPIGLRARKGGSRKMSGNRLLYFVKTVKKRFSRLVNMD